MMSINILTFKSLKKVQLILVAIVMMIASNVTTAQVAINTDGSNPDGSAMLDIKSTDKGLLLPRVANVSVISNPAAGLMVFDEETNCMRYYNGTVWSQCLGRIFTCGDTLIDSRDGQIYSTVQIGNQCWMAENINVGTMIAGGNNQTDNGTIEKYCYGDNTSNCDTYGGLYQWNEMMQYVTTEGTQGICPTGWHLPSDDEWKTVEMQLGMTQAEADGTGWRGTDEGSKMAGNESLWSNGNLDQNANFGTSGLRILPAGRRSSNGSFAGRGSYTYLLSSTENGTKAWERYLRYNNIQVSRINNDKAYAYNVRCVKN